MGIKHGGRKNRSEVLVLVQRACPESGTFRQQGLGGKLVWPEMLLQTLQFPPPGFSHVPCQRTRVGRAEDGSGNS